MIFPEGNNILYKKDNQFGIGVPSDVDFNPVVITNKFIRFHSILSGVIDVYLVTQQAPEEEEILPKNTTDGPNIWVCEKHGKKPYCFTLTINDGNTINYCLDCFKEFLDNNVRKVLSDY